MISSRPFELVTPALSQVVVRTHGWRCYLLLIASIETCVQVCLRTLIEPLESFARVSSGRFGELYTSAAQPLLLGSRSKVDLIGMGSGSEGPFGRMAEFYQPKHNRELVLGSARCIQSSFPQWD